MLLAVKTRNVIGAVRFLYCHSQTALLFLVKIVVIMSALLFFAVILSWRCSLRGYAVTLKFVPVVNTPWSASFTQEIYRLLNLSCDSKFRDNILVAVMSKGRFISERRAHKSSYIFRR